MRKILFLSFCLLGLEPIYGASPVCNRVLEYRPAPGQFINELPEYVPGDDETSMKDKVYDYIVNEDAIISLGAYGGYVTYGFEKTIVNSPNARDFYVEGNALQSIATQTKGGSSEPGIILVSFDLNKNGLPDDKWFEIAGSKYDESLTDYEITYYKPNSNDEDIRWTDNFGGSGFVYRNSVHKQSYWPEWISEPQLVFKGSQLPNNSTLEGNQYVLLRYDYGYADNYPNFESDKITRSEGAKIDIDWAVDEYGNKVNMPGVDFVRIYTGINASNGILGENSTEVKKVINNHTVMENGTEVVDENIKMDEKLLSDFLAKYSEGSIVEMEDNNIKIHISREGILSFYLNCEDLVQVYNQSGMLFLSAVKGAGYNTIDMSSLQSGLYLIKIGNSVNKILKK